MRAGEKSHAYTAVMKRRNGQARAAVAWGAVSMIGMAGALLPLTWGQMDRMDGGYALAFGGGVLAVCGAAAAWVFALRARILARLFSGTGQLAHWTYLESEQAMHADRECAEGRRRNRALFRVIAAVCAAIALLYLLADPDAGRVVIPVLIGTLLLSAAGAEVQPRLRRWRRRRGVPEAIVSLEAAYVLGTLHAWTLLGAHIKDCGIAPGGAPELSISYSLGMLGGRGPASATVPVPPGEEARASDIARALRAVHADTALLE
jgi:hypothetical protein